MTQIAGQPRTRGAEASAERRRHSDVKVFVDQAAFPPSAHRAITIVNTLGRSRFVTAPATRLAPTTAVAIRCCWSPLACAIRPPSKRRG